MADDYGLVVTGNDAQGDYIISDSASTLVPYVIANIGKGTSADLPNTDDYLLYINAKGTYPSQITNTAITATNATRDTTTNTAYFWSASATFIVDQKKGTTTVSPTWFSQSVYYVILTRTSAINAPATPYGIRVQNGAGDVIFDSSKIYVNDSFRILGQYEFTDPYQTLNNSQQQTVTTDENMFVEMSPFTYDTTSSTATPGTANTGICGPYFDTNEIDHSLNVSFNGIGTYYGAYTFGKLLYNNANPADALNALPAGFTVPY